jgi:3-phosphoshikimate 1-carboxyvinyltransferase
MAFAIAGMFAEGTTTIEGTECIATSYPGFEHHLDLFLHGDTAARPIPTITRIPPH